MGRTTNRWMQYGGAALAASSLLAVAACGSSSKGGTNAPSSSAPASTAPSTSGVRHRWHHLQRLRHADGVRFDRSGERHLRVGQGLPGCLQGCGHQLRRRRFRQGRHRFTAGTDDFAGSDFPLTTSQKSDANKVCSGGEAVDLPMAPGGIAVAYNLPGVTSLNLSASTIAKIFSGKITKWDDAAIKADNSGVTLPSTAIQTFHRSDGSGTTYNFTNYLTNVAKSDWTYNFGKTWTAPGGQGAKGSSSVAQGVKSTAGAVGYFETSYATQDSLSVAKVGDAGGKFVEDTGENVTAFLAKATVAGSGNDLALKFDYTTADGWAYPITLVTYEITCTKGGKKAGLVKSFLSYTSSTDGQAVLPTAGYVKLPDNIVSKVAGVVAGIS